MHPAKRDIGVLMAPFVVWSSCLWAQTPAARKDPATTVRPV
jgi:hypothetical protein